MSADKYGDTPVMQLIPSETYGMRDALVRVRNAWGVDADVGWFLFWDVL